MLLLSLFLLVDPVVLPVDTSQVLSHGIIWTVNQDETGFIWIGTSSGLFRYDGRQLKSYKRDPEDSHGISDNLIRDTLIDSDGRLWIGTANGLNLMVGDGSFESWHGDPDNPATLGHNYINTLVEGHHGRLWVGTRRGLSLFDPTTGSVVRYDTNSGLSGTRVQCLLVDQEGALWIGSEGGLDFWDPVTDQIRPWRGISEQTARQQISEILQDRDGRIWVAGTTGVSCINPESGIELPFLTSSSAGLGPVESLVEGAGDFLWAGSRDGALIRIHRHTGAYEVYRDQRPSNVLRRKDIVSMFIDQSRVLWMGTFLTGLYKADLKPSKFQPLPVQDGEGRPLVEIQAVAIDDADVLWLGSQRGLISYDPKDRGVTHYRAQPQNPRGLSEDQILSLLADGDRLWVGTFTGGLNRLDRASGQFDRFTFKQGEGVLSRNVVLKIFKDRAGTLWAGTRGGLTRFDRDINTLAPYPLMADDSELAGLNMVQEILQDKDGLLWIGADGSGLCQLNLETGEYQWFRYDHRDPESLIGNRVNALCQTPDGNLWIGTHTGISRWLPQTQTFQNFGGVDLEMGLILSIVPGREGELWLGSNDGLLRFDPNPTGKPLLRRFDTSDGLVGNSFFRGVALAGEEGEILFGGPDGLSHFAPGRMRFNTVEPTVAVTSFKIFHRETSLPAGPLNLRHNQNHFSLEFAALDFTAPHKNRYAYKLEGFDKNWNQGGNRAFANYTNLPDGDYTLRIKGSNNDGVWNEEGLTLPIVIKPPFWRTTLFRLLLFSCGVLILIFMHRRGVHGVRKRNWELERLVAEKTDNLENARRKLLDLAHQSGMFEITHGVLEQISEQMTAVKRQVTRFDRELERSPLGQFENTVNQLETEGERERAVKDLFQSESDITLRWDTLSHITEDLLHHINLMRDTITMQHGYAKMELYTQEVSICTLVDDAILLAGNQIRQMEVLIHKHYLARPKCRLAKVKMLHVLSMVIQNSLEAMQETQSRQLTLEVGLTVEQQVRMVIIDTGCGIDPTIGEQIFNYGYSTKAGHSGFGLHDCANAMHQLGGTIDIDSGPEGVGAAVTILLPLIKA